MPSQKQDYILREIELLGRYVANLRRRRRGKPLDETEKTELNETLLRVMYLQEQNFGMPAATFLSLTADEQIATLRKGESKPSGQERCLTYATILKETANLYEFRDSASLALGARQLALYVALSVAVDQSAGSPAANALVQELRAALGEAELHAPTIELLEQFERG